MTERFRGAPRQHTHAPVVAAREGEPPAFVVVCLTPRCGFAHDAHGLTAEDAVKAVAATHDRTHKLIARQIDYTAGWERPGRPLEGVGPSTGPHPLYGA